MAHIAEPLIGNVSLLHGVPGVSAANSSIPGEIHDLCCVQICFDRKVAYLLSLADGTAH